MSLRFYGCPMSPLAVALVACSGCALPLEPDVTEKTGGDGACTARTMEHAGACTSEPCAIVADVEIFCGYDEFADPGIRVAPAPGATWLATSSSHGAIVHRIAGGQAQRH